MKQKDPIGRLHEWAGSYVVLMAREPGVGDTPLLDSMNEEESRTLCACAMAILMQRARQTKATR